MKPVFIKIVLTISCCIALVHFCQAQTWDEWFKQKKTQTKYLLEQIAKLQVYLEYVKKGYRIVDKGLTTIGDIKNGDFNLHQLFFDGLKNVNPRILQYARVADMIKLQSDMLHTYKKFYKQFSGSGMFSASEIDYLYKVFSHLMDAVADNIAQLTVLVSNSQLELSDDERLTRIDQLHADMQDQYQFLISFSGRTNLLATQRLQEEKELQKLFKLYQP